MTEPDNKLEKVREIFAGYKGGEDMPLAGYAGLLFIYNAALIAGWQAADKAGYELPEKVNYGDLILLGVATHKLSRIITKDRVTSPLRAPFTEYIEPAGESEVKEKVRGRGLQLGNRRFADLPVVHESMGGGRARARFCFQTSRDTPSGRNFYGGHDCRFSARSVGSG
jgi:hypothetical protein